MPRLPRKRPIVSFQILRSSSGLYSSGRIRDSLLIFVCKRLQRNLKRKRNNQKKSHLEAPKDSEFKRRQMIRMRIATLKMVEV